MRAKGRSARRWMASFLLGASRPLAVGATTATLCVLFLWSIDLASVRRAIARARLHLLGGAIALVSVSLAVRALRWRALLAGLGRPGFFACFEATVIGLMLNSVAPTGRLGEVVRPFLLARREGFAASSTFATVVLERVLDLATVVVLLGGSLVLAPSAASVRGQMALQALRLGALTSFVIVVVLLAGMRVVARRPEGAVDAMRVLGRWLPAHLLESAMRHLRTSLEGLRALAGSGRLGLIAVLSVAVWIAIALAMWLASLAVQGAFPFHATFLVLGFVAVGVAAPTPGGIGGYHLMFSLVLTLVLGVDEAVAKAAAIVSHAVGLVPPVLIGVVFWVRAGLTTRDLRGVVPGPASAHPQPSTPAGESTGW